jgi:hypothetical protein
MNSRRQINIKQLFTSWNFLFGSFIFFSAAITAWLLSLDPDPKNAFLFGYSIYRLLMVLFLLICGCGSLILLLKNRRGHSITLLLEKKLLSEENIRKFLVTLFFVLLLNWLLLAILSSGEKGALLAIRSRLLPFIVWLFLVCFTTLLWVIVKKFEISFQRSNGQKKLILISIFIFAISLIIWIVVALSRIGIEPDNFGWGRRMVPLLSWQVGFTWVISLLLISVHDWMTVSGKIVDQLKRKYFGLPLIDILIFGLLWMFALALWYIQIPGIKGYPSPSVSNPDRDSALYEVAVQSLLHGYGFYGHELVPRPLYLLGLAFIHLFSGNSYPQIVFGQTMVIALMPGILYLLGGKTGNRVVGIVVGLLAIFREYNSLLSSRFGIVSNSRMLMSDVPTTLAICLVTFICVSWLSHRKTGLIWSICSGGVLACSILVRTQTVVLIPVVVIISFFAFIKDKKFKLWLRDIGLFLIIIAIVITPWIIRNYSIIGSFVLDDPRQTRLAAQRYTDQDTAIQFDIKPGETEEEFSNRLSENISTFIQSNPLKVLEFTSSHFSRNLMDTVLVLPYRLNFLDYRDNAVISTAFWHPWEPDFGLGGILLIGLNILFISIGLVFAVQKIGIVGLLPLGFNLAYNLSNALARNSGYRFMLPVDWISYLYYGAGMVVAVNWILLVVGLKKSSLLFETEAEIPTIDISTSIKSAITRKAAIWLVVFFLIGISLPLSEVLIPQKYPAIDKEKFANGLLTQTGTELSATEIDGIRRFIAMPDTVAVNGLLMLPSFIPANTAGGGLVYVETVDYSRYFFMLIRSKPTGITLQSDERKTKFPDFSEVVIIGCKKGDIVDAKLVIAQGEPEKIYRVNNYDNLFCEKK